MKWDKLIMVIIVIRKVGLLSSIPPRPRIMGIFIDRKFSSKSFISLVMNGMARNDGKLHFLESRDGSVKQSNTQPGSWLKILIDPICWTRIAVKSSPDVVHQLLLLVYSLKWDTICD